MGVGGLGALTLRPWEGWGSGGGGRAGALGGGRDGLTFLFVRTEIVPSVL